MNYGPSTHCGNCHKWDRPLSSDIQKELRGLAMDVCIPFVYMHIYEGILRTGKSLRTGKLKVDSRFHCLGSESIEKKGRFSHFALCLWFECFIVNMCSHIICVIKGLELICLSIIILTWRKLTYIYTYTYTYRKKIRKEIHQCFHCNCLISWKNTLNFLPFNTK